MEKGGWRSKPTTTGRPPGHIGYIGIIVKSVIQGCIIQSGFQYILECKLFLTHQITLLTEPRKWEMFLQTSQESND